MFAILLTLEESHQLLAQLVACHQLVKYNTKEVQNILSPTTNSLTFICLSPEGCIDSKYISKNLTRIGIFNGEFDQ